MCRATLGLAGTSCDILPFVQIAKDEASGMSTTFCTYATTISHITIGIMAISQIHSHTQETFSEATGELYSHQSSGPCKEVG
jgi:hypothetical protein